MTITLPSYGVESSYWYCWKANNLLFPVVYSTHIPESKQKSNVRYIGRTFVQQGTFNCKSVTLQSGMHCGEILGDLFTGSVGYSVTCNIIAAHKHNIFFLKLVFVVPTFLTETVLQWHWHECKGRLQSHQSRSQSQGGPMGVVHELLHSLQHALISMPGDVQTLQKNNVTPSSEKSQNVRQTVRQQAIRCYIT